MSDLARALAGRGHHIIFVYFFSSTDPTSPATVERVIAMGSEPQIETAGVDVAAATPPELQTYAEIAAAEAAAAARAARETVRADQDRLKAFKVRLQALVPRLPPMFEVMRATAEWARRHNLHRFYPKNTRLSRALYSLAFNIDQFSAREMMTTFRRMVELRIRLRRLRFVGQAHALEVAYQSAAMVAQYSRSLQFFGRSIRSRLIDAVILPEDIVGNTWPMAIAAAHRRGIPALVLPYTLANREEAVQSLKGEEAYQSRNNELASMLFPRWRYQEGEIDIVRLPSAHIFAHEELGVTPPDPWTMNSGFADKILVDSEASLDYFAAAGIPRGQMVVVGSVSQDRMFEIRQQRSQHLDRLRNALSLDGERPLLLISGCPNQLSAAVPSCEFQNMQQLAEFVGRTVAPLAGQYDLVVRPHPNFPEFGTLLAPFGIRTTDAPTASLVPLADLFIAFASATIRWAIACGVPTINYDVFNYGYGDFNSATGVVTVASAADFRTQVQASSPGSLQLATLVSNAQADSARWSLMDGRGLVRVEEEIYRACAQRV